MARLILIPGILICMLACIWAQEPPSSPAPPPGPPGTEIPAEALPQPPPAPSPSTEPVQPIPGPRSQPLEGAQPPGAPAPNTPPTPPTPTGASAQSKQVNICNNDNFEFCRRCVRLKNGICYNGECFSKCPSEFPNFYQGQCYRCPRTHPWFSCKKTECFKCKEGSFYFRGKCVRCRACFRYSGNGRCRKVPECRGVPPQPPYCFEDSCKALLPYDRSSPWPQ